MPPRKRQYFKRPQRRAPNNNPQDRLSEQAVDAAARQLMASNDLTELRMLAQRTREAFQWADQEAQQQPSPEALRRFRIAQRRLAEVDRALDLAET